MYIEIISIKNVIDDSSVPSNQFFQLRQMNASLRHGIIQFFHEDSDNHVLAFSQNEDIIIICHFSSETTLNYILRNIPKSGNWTDALTNEQVNVDQEKNLTLELSPFAARVFVSSI